MVIHKSMRVLVWPHSALSGDKNQCRSVDDDTNPRTLVVAQL